MAGQPAAAPLVCPTCHCVRDEGLYSDDELSRIIRDSPLITAEEQDLFKECLKYTSFNPNTLLDWAAQSDNLAAFQAITPLNNVSRDVLESLLRTCCSRNSIYIAEVLLKRIGGQCLMGDDTRMRLRIHANKKIAHLLIPYMDPAVLINEMNIFITSCAGTVGGVDCATTRGDEKAVCDIIRIMDAYIAKHDNGKSKLTPSTSNSMVVRMLAKYYLRVRDYHSGY